MNRRLRWGVCAVALAAILVPADSSASDGTDDVAETVATHVSQLREARAKWRAVGLAKLRLVPRLRAPLPGELPDPDDSEKRELERLGQLEGGVATFEAEKTVKALDSALRETVFSAFESDLSFDEIQRVTRGLVKWEQWPDVFAFGYEYLRAESDVLDRIPQGLRKGDQMGQEAWLADENLIIVGYRTRKAPSGETVYAFQNTFWNLDYSRSRCVMSAYAVAKSEVIHYSTFFEEHSTDHADTNICTVFLGFLDRPDSLPWILMVYGPDGNVAGISILGYRYDPESSAWKHSMGSYEEGIDYVDSYEYDPSTAIITLHDRDFRSEVEQLAEPLENDTSTFDIGKRIGEIEEKLAKPRQ